MFKLCGRYLVLLLDVVEELIPTYHLALRVLADGERRLEFFDDAEVAEVHFALAAGLLLIEVAEAADSLVCSGEEDGALLAAVGIAVQGVAQEDLLENVFVWSALTRILVGHLGALFGFLFFCE